jgi:hypothetical protein
MRPYFMNKDELLAAVLASDKLPTLPPVASRLVALTAKDDTSFTDIANLVSQDKLRASGGLDIGDQCAGKFGFIIFISVHGNQGQ